MNPVAGRGWAAVAVVATMTLAACTGGARAKTTAAGRIATGARSAAELSKALDITVPDGFVRQPDDVGDTGPSDLDKAVADDGDADARDVLTRDRFVRGYQRMWRRGEDEIVSYVYQFADHAGAVDYTNRLTGDPGTGEGSRGVFSVPAIAGAVGVNGTDAPFATSSVTFVKGPYSVQVVVNGASSDGLQPLASALAEEQFARL